MLYILRVSCADKPGIVADVARCLKDYGCNIEEAAQFDDALSGCFFMRVVFRFVQDDAQRLPVFISRFGSVAEHFSMVWSVHPADEKIPTLVMVSKEDHCLNDLLYRERTGQLPIRIAAVVSNHPDVRELVEWHGHRFVHLPVTSETKEAQEQAVIDLIDESGAELVVLARYMQVLSDRLCSLYAGRIINIHHSFLPGFKGAKPYHQAYVRGVKLIGASAHFVTADLDEGPIIEQETMRISHSHDPLKLQALGRDVESRVLAQAVRFYAERRIFLQGNRTVVL
jgi:formyltetrahydrofolate deformylase